MWTLQHAHSHTQIWLVDWKSPQEKCASAQIYVFIKLDHCNTNAMEIESLSVHKMILVIEEDTDYLILRWNYN